MNKCVALDVDQEPVHGSHGYPRPQLQRSPWWNLNGTWEFCIDEQAQYTQPNQVEWNQTIQVPFAPETEASGIGNTGFYLACWYRRTFIAPEVRPDQRLILRFEAVDTEATVWVNGVAVGRHEGGYSPFSFDITDYLDPKGEQVIVVRAFDDPADLAKPRGKQDWQAEPHVIWYPRTTGIWQTVWLERVSSVHIGMLRWTPNVERWELGLEFRLDGTMRRDMTVNVHLCVGDHLLAEDTYRVVSCDMHRRIALSDPGIDDYRNELLWSPATPTLVDAKVELHDRDGRLVDKIHSYTALRSIGVQGDRFVLNGRPYYLRMVLDQGYWPQSGLTAPDDAAVKRDVQLANAMGFNGVRCHQRVPDPRYLYWADKLGLMVWSEMPSAYRFTRRSVERVTREWLDVIRRDVSHPCVIAWVPFNESWGVPDLPDSAAQRHYVQALYHLTRTLDPTRPVVGNDGWESVATDIIGIHDYEHDPQRVAERYGSVDLTSQLFQHERPGGRMLLIDHELASGLPIMLTEFGGIVLSDRKDSFGYSRVPDDQAFAKRYRELLKIVRSRPVLAGFCYTQFADTYQETNGLLYADRRPKIPLREIALATAGPETVARDRQMEMAWRERMMTVARRHYLMPDANHEIDNTR